MLGVLRKLRERDIPAEILFVGEQGKTDSLEYTAEVKKAMNADKLAKYVYYRTHRPARDYLFGALDLSLYCNPKDRYGFQLIEAFASGVPVVASQSVVSDSLVNPPENGLVYPENDMQTLTEMLTEVYRNPQSAKTRVENARRFVNEQYSIESLNRAFEELYDKVVK
jgi:glycosyltransferase involved in cell wall biosynthesis